MSLSAVFERQLPYQNDLFPHLLREEADHRPERLHETEAEEKVKK